NRLAASARRDPETLERMLARMEAEPIARHSYFTSTLAEHLQDEEAALAPVQQWIEERLHTRVADLIRREHAREAADRLSAANVFESLRTLSRLDFTEIFEATSRVEAELRADPAG